MRVLIDISHPAHVHFYRHIHARLVERGVGVLVVARDKDVTLRLLDAYAIPHLSVGRSGIRTMSGQLVELIRRDWFLLKHGGRFQPQIVLTRNPAGVQAARLLRVLGVFDTDDGRSVGVHYHAAAPFAHVITAPDSLTESLGGKGRKYPSYKSLAYLHPSVYTPNPGIRDVLRMEESEEYSVLRLVAHDASHDRHTRGLTGEALQKVVALLSQRGPVFLSSESSVVGVPNTRSLTIPPERIHDVLAEALIVVGDSQTVVTEAALLGTPAVRINSFATTTPYLNELEYRYGLARSFFPEAIEDALVAIEEMSLPGHKEEWRRRREVMLDDKVSLTDWYFDLVMELLESRR